MKLLMMLFLMLPSHSFAQGDHSGGGFVAPAPIAHSGGGGEVLACSAGDRHGLFSFLKPRPMAYFLRDVYEANKTTQHKLNLRGPDEGVELTIPQKIKLIYDNYSQLDPVRAKNYLDEALKMAADLEEQEQDRPAPFGRAVLLNQRLKRIDDGDDKFIFNECRRYQLVRQEPPQLGGAFYTFDKRYWKRLDDDNKVATIYHEVIYREFREYGAQVSRPSRKLNSILFSQHAATLSLKEYLDFLSANRARNYFYRTNIGDLNIHNLVELQNDWTAKIVANTYLTDISMMYAGMNWESLPFGRSIQVKGADTLSFDQARRLIGVKGNFEILYNPYTKRILNGSATCNIELQHCLRTKYIKVEQDGTLSINGTAGGGLHFDSLGNVISFF